MLNILKIIAAAATVITGLYSLFAPRRVRDFTGLEMPSGRGVTEVRSILGGLFVAVGAAPILFASPDMYLMLGIMYLVVAAVRAVSMFVDQSLVSSNTISLAVEVIFGFILVL